MNFDGQLGFDLSIKFFEPIWRGNKGLIFKFMGVEIETFC